MNASLLRKTGPGQALVIIILSVMLSFAYTGLTRKGLFGPPTSVPPGAPRDTITATFLSYDQASLLYERAHPLFVDARHEYDFGLGHIKGAINLPLQDFDPASPRLQLIPKDTLLITYCDGEECNSSVALAAKLSDAGYTNVRVFFGGWKEWLAHQQPVAR